MRNIAYCITTLLLVSTVATGCFKEVREAPSSTTTIEKRSSVETAPRVDKRTTVETTY